MAPQSEVLDGFWIPSHLRRILRDAEWEIHGSAAHGSVAHSSAAHGSATHSLESPGVKVRWPVFDSSQWQRLTGELQKARASPTSSVTALLERWKRPGPKCPES